MRDGLLFALALALGLVALTACTRRDEALDAVGHAQVIDIRGEDPDVVFTSHLERKGVRWTRRNNLERPANKPFLKADPPKGDDSVESPAVDRFLRAVATNHRGPTSAIPPPSSGKVKMTIIGPAGKKPVVLERTSAMAWTVDGDPLSDWALIDASYRAMVKEIGIDAAVEWQHSGTAY
jgi:hypothetical protein